jgi:hypothetical protein
MRKFVLFVTLLILCLAALRFAACKHEPVLPVVTPPPTPPPSKNCTPDTVYFQNEVLPLFQSYCGKSGCHDGTGEGGNLNDYYSIFQVGVVPGNPGASRVYYAITVGGEEGKMPPGNQPQLNDAQIQLISKWIMQGALNNKCDSAGCDTIHPTYSLTIGPVIQTYCLGCHSAPNPAGSINLSTYDAVKSVAAGGRLMGAIRQLPGFFAMPKNGDPLSTCQIAEFQKWIDLTYPPK